MLVYLVEDLSFGRRVGGSVHLGESLYEPSNDIFEICRRSFFFFFFFLFFSLLLPWTKVTTKSVLARGEEEERRRASRARNDRQPKRERGRENGAFLYVRRETRRSVHLQPNMGIPGIPRSTTATFFGTIDAKRVLSSR